MTIQTYPIVAQLDAADGRMHRREIVLVLNNAMRGKLNCAFEITLSDAEATAVIDDRLHQDCVLLFDPLDELADTAMRVGPLFVAEADRSQGQCTITHADDVGGARFRVAVFS